MYQTESVAENNEDEYGSGSDEEDDTDEEDDDLEDGYNCQLNYLEKSGLEVDVHFILWW